LCHEFHRNISCGALARRKTEESGMSTLFRRFPPAHATRPSDAHPHPGGIRAGKKHLQTPMCPSVVTLEGNNSALTDHATVFDRYFSLPTALARHKSAPLLKERERFLAHLEATGTRRSIPSIDRRTTRRRGFRFCYTRRQSTETQHLAIQLRAPLRTSSYSPGAQLQPNARNA